MLEVKDVLRPNDNVIYLMFWSELCYPEAISVLVDIAYQFPNNDDC